MKTFDFRLVEAANSTRECYRCGERIGAGELVIEGFFLAFTEWRDTDSAPPLDDTRTENNTKLYHVDCAIDVDVESTSIALRTDRGRDRKFDSARTLIAARKKAINALARARTSGAVPSAKPAVEIEPARDRKGRPRVTVVVVGSASSSTSRAWSDLTELAHDFTVTSPLREYVFEALVGNATTQVAADPSQPLVAAVFAVLGDVKIVKAQRDKLAALRALNTPTPLLWLLSANVTDAKWRDEKILALRGELERVGFAADEAAVLCATSVDTSALRDLALALDGTSSRSAAPKNFAGTFENAVVALEQAVRDDAREQFAPLAESVAALIAAANEYPAPRSSHDRSYGLEARVRAAASAALREPSARERSLALLARFDNAEDAPQIESLLRSMLDEGGRSFHRSFQGAATLLERWSPERLHAFAADAMIAENTGKSRYWQLAPLLSSCADLAIAARLRAFAAGAKKNDFRATMAELRAVEIESRANAKSEKDAAAPRTSDTTPSTPAKE